MESPKSYLGSTWPDRSKASFRKALREHHYYITSSYTNLYDFEHSMWTEKTETPLVMVIRLAVPFPRRLAEPK